VSHQLYAPNAAPNVCDLTRTGSQADLLSAPFQVVRCPWEVVGLEQVLCVFVGFRCPGIAKNGCSSRRGVVPPWGWLGMAVGSLGRCVSFQPAPAFPLRPSPPLVLQGLLLSVSMPRSRSPQQRPATGSAATLAWQGRATAAVCASSGDCDGDHHWPSCLIATAAGTHLLCLTPLGEVMGPWLPAAAVSLGGCVRVCPPVAMDVAKATAVARSCAYDALHECFDP